MNKNKFLYFCVAFKENSLYTIREWRRSPQPKTKEEKMKTQIKATIKGREVKVEEEEKFELSLWEESSRIYKKILVGAKEPLVLSFEGTLLEISIEDWAASLSEEAGRPVSLEEALEALELGDFGVSTPELMRAEEA